MITAMKHTLFSLLKQCSEKLTQLPPYVLLPIAYLAVPTVINTALNLFFFTSNDFDGARKFSGILLSYLFSYLLYAFFLGIYRRAKAASLTMAILYFALGYVNQMKMVISGMNPIFLSDLFFVSDAQSLAVMVGYSDLGGIVIDYLPQTLLFLLLLSIAVLFTFFWNYRIRIQKHRLIALVATALAILLIFIPIKPFHAALYSLFFKEKAGHDPVAYYNENGFLSGILGQYWNSHPIIENTDDKAAEILESVPENTNGSWGKPNIIMIFSESFFDLSKLEDVSFSTAPTENYSRLKEQGISFSMLSPTIGGLSCNSEYQILTGGNMGYYPLGYVPYTMMYQDSDMRRYDYPSVIEEFNNNGYTTEIVSTWQKNLCNCDTVYESMGLDLFLYDYGEEIKGLYYSDATVANKIKQTFDEKDSDAPLFFFTQTAQAHMPYFAEKYHHYDIEVISSPLTEKENGILTSYAQGIYDADRMLNDVYAYIQTLSEPTLLVFFGDHLPTLSDCSVNLFDKLAYFNTEDKLLNEARRYTTEGLILANFPLEDTVDYLGQDLLIPYIFSNTTLEVSPFYRYLAQSAKVLPAVGTFAAYAPDGTLYFLDAMPEAMKKIYEERRALQYTLFD